MAIQKDKTLSNGIVGNYWKITFCALDSTSNTVQYVISLFIDKMRCDTGASDLGFNKKYSFILTDDQILGNLISLGYTAILAKAVSQVPGSFTDPTAPTITFDPDLANGTSV